MKKAVAVMVLILTVAVWAQTPPVFPAPQWSVGGPIATSPSQCATPAAHQGSWCPVETSPGVIVYYGWNGSAWQQLAFTAAPVSPVLTVNGKKPDASGNVTLAASTTLN